MKICWQYRFCSKVSKKNIPNTLINIFNNKNNKQFFSSDLKLKKYHLKFVFNSSKIYQIYMKLFILITMLTFGITCNAVLQIKIIYENTVVPIAPLSNRI